MMKLTTPLTQVDTEATFTVGTKTMTKDGNEYIYLPGVASVAANDAVVIKTVAGTLSYGSVTRLAANVTGPVAFAQGAIINNRWGWFGIAGMFKATAGDVTASGSALYASGTAGAVGGVISANHLIHGAVAVSANAGGTTQVMISHPFVGASAH